MFKVSLLALALSFALQVKASVYEIDPVASSINWKGSKKIGDDSHNGSISIKDGEIKTGPKGDIVAGNFVIDMKTITSEDLKKDPKMQKKLVGHLSSSDFFNVEKHPTSTFKITSITKKGKNHTVKGDLTILGKTHSIEFPANIATTKDGLTGTAKFTIDRTKWGIKYGSGNFFKELTADKIINNEIEFELKLVAKPDAKAKSTAKN